MIEYLRGKVIDKEEYHIILDVNGVGYGMNVSAMTYKIVPEIGFEKGLFIHFHHTENDMTLFGFNSKPEKEVFEVLISVSGIGPKMAMTILSAMPIENFAEAIIGKRIDVLTEISGIGKKTAERLIIELKDKVQKFFKKSKTEIEALEEEALSMPPKISDAVSALVNLGIKPSTAYAAVKKAFKAIGEEATTEQLIKEGLKYR